MAVQLYIACHMDLGNIYLIMVGGEVVLSRFWGEVEFLLDQGWRLKRGEFFNTLLANIIKKCYKKVVFMKNN